MGLLLFQASDPIRRFRQLMPQIFLPEGLEGTIAFQVLDMEFCTFDDGLKLPDTAANCKALRRALLTVVLLMYADGRVALLYKHLDPRHWFLNCYLFF